MGEPLLVLGQVSKSFPDGLGRSRPILTRVDWTLGEGETHVIRGPSGSGKTTLLHILARLIQPDTGTLAWKGRDITRLSPDETAAFRRDSIGVVFQDHLLLPHLTALENICLPALARGEGHVGPVRDRAIRQMDLIGLGDRKNDLPETLSGGERQRVAVLRALSLKPSLVLADEPTGALDRRHAEGVMDLMRAQCREHGATLVVVTHGESPGHPGDRSWRIQGETLIPMG